MIRIKRTDCPNHLDTSHKILVENDYHNDTVLDALLKMQHFKCCYCEKYLPPLGKSAKWVDHFIARTDNSFKNAAGIINWNRANAWSNLLYACSTCNSSKGTEKPFDNRGHRKLIDPSYPRIDPERYIGFYINDILIFYKEINGSNLGKSTIANMKLDIRKDLYSNHIKIKIEIDAIFSDFVSASIEGNEIKTNSKLIELRKMTSAHQPHASFCRKYIIQKVNKFNNNDLQIINQEFGMQLTPIDINIAKRSQVIE